MDDLAARGAPLEYWFFRTDSGDLSFLVDLIVRRGEHRAETRVASRVGDVAGVERAFSDTWSADAQGIRAGESHLGASTTRGRVGEIAWSLDVDLGPDRIRPLPPALSWLRPFDMQLVSRPTARFTGSISIGGRTWTLESRPGMVSHYWGRALPRRWTWVSVTGEATEPRLESTVLSSRIWGTPLAVTCGYFWRSGEPPAGRPVLAVMPLNGVVRSTPGAPGAARVRAWRPRRFAADVDCQAADESFADLGEGIRQSLAADVVADGRRLRGALEFRD